MSLCLAALLLSAVPVLSLHFAENDRTSQRALVAQWTQELDGMGKIVEKESPIQRVVRLLTEMKTQLEAEASADEEAYDKMVCWCETNDKEKSKAIADADAHITDLVAEIEERSARDAELQTQIEHLGQQIADEKKALEEATGLREKEYAEFTTEEKEMIQAVTMLKNAIIILGRHHAGMLQLTPAMLQSLGSVLRWASLKREEMMATKETITSAGAQTGISLLSKTSWSHAEHR